MQHKTHHHHHHHPAPSERGLFKKERICFPWEQIFQFRIDPFSEARQNNFDSYLPLSISLALKAKYAKDLWWMSVTTQAIYVSFLPLYIYRDYQKFHFLHLLLLILSVLHVLILLFFSLHLNNSQLLQIFFVNISRSPGKRPIWLLYLP